MTRSSLAKFFEATPGISFLLAYILTKNFNTATIVLIISSIISLLYAWCVNKKVAHVQVFATILIIIFGALTIINDNSYFLKIKVSIINLIWALILVCDLFILKKNLLKKVFGTVLNWPQHAWRSLTVSWILFFISCALLNEAVWRNSSDASWVYFKIFGLLPITIIFTIASIFYTQYRLKV